MSEYSDHLRNAIRKLEDIRDKQDPPDLKVISLLDSLYEIDLKRIEAHIDIKSEEYSSACNALKNVSAIAEEFLEDMKQMKDTMEKIDKAIETAIKFAAMI